jgi:hypothetical protein
LINEAGLQQGLQRDADIGAPRVEAPDARSQQTQASGPLDGPRHQKWCRAEVPPGADSCPRCGVWQPKNKGAAQHEAYSVQRREALAPIVAKHRRGILRQLGHTEANVPPTKSLVIDSLIELRIVAASYFAFLVANSDGAESLAVTRTGRTRAAALHHGAAVDRIKALAESLGLEDKRRRGRRGDPMSALRARLEGTDG